MGGRDASPRRPSKRWFFSPTALWGGRRKIVPRNCSPPPLWRRVKFHPPPLPPRGGGKKSLCGPPPTKNPPGGKKGTPPPKRGKGKEKPQRGTLPRAPLPPRGRKERGDPGGKPPPGKSEIPKGETQWILRAQSF